MLWNSINIILLLLVSSIACNKPQIEHNKNSTEDNCKLSIKNIDYSYICALQSVKYTLPFTQYLFENVNKIPEFSNSATQSFVYSKNNIQSLFHYSYQLLSSSAGGFGPPLADVDKGKSIRNQNDLDKYFEISEFEIIHKEQWEKLPFSFRKGIIEILYSIEEAKIIFEQFSKPVQEYLKIRSAFFTSEIYDELIIPWNQRELNELISVDLIKDANLIKLSFATRKITEKLNWFFMQKELKIPEDFTNCSINTDMGELFVSGIKNDTIKGEQFFVVELGGDDIYYGNTASTLSMNKPFGIVVDLKGNDKYLCGDNFLAAGILGIAVLMDLEGHDIYQTTKPGLAFSLYGSSLLYDYSGNDQYTGSEHSQAASYIGASLLVDISGNDKYYSNSNSQAFGGTLGVGILFDNIGNDYYHTGKIAGNANHFSQSFVQGAAKGRWAEATDGHSLAGGIGVFIDNEGNDNYAARSFSQGASYYFGLGLFNDKNGDDKYNAISHSQGYASHYSLAGFFEQSGNDTYNVESPKDNITQIIGGGRDFSAGLFVEFAGNDIYNFGNRSAGIGDVIGIGLFADYYGNDNYIWHKNKLNYGSLSLGKEAGLGDDMKMGSKIFQPKDVVQSGIFMDIKGINNFE